MKYLVFFFGYPSELSSGRTGKGINTYSGIPGIHHHESKKSAQSNDKMLTTKPLIFYLKKRYVMIKKP
jgi:hypothetical protein